MQASRPRLFGTNGVRGMYGEELTHDLVIDLCYALGTYFGMGPIVVGYDGRRSSPVQTLAWSPLRACSTPQSASGTPEAS
jgi:phosphomannomutase